MRWCLIVVEIHISLMMCVLDSSVGKESAFSAGDSGSILGWEHLAEGNGYPLQYSGLETSMGCIVYRVRKSRAQ